MAAMEMNNIDKLDQEDREKVSYFIKLLLQQAKYQALKKDCSDRANASK